MTVTATTLVSAKVVESLQTTQYTATNVTAIIDKFTATNFSAAVASLSVNLVSISGSPGDDNLIVKAKALQPGETYLFPELVGQVLTPGSSISTLTTAAASINLRVSGRVVT
jgi:hypothetical protein